MKSVGVEQRSDKERPGQTINTHQCSRKFSERTRERIVKRKQERCRKIQNSHIKYMSRN